MKKRILIVVLIALFLAVGTVVGAGAIHETKPQPPEERHTISEIVDPEDQWEKVVTGSGFIEGINFDRDGEMWLVSPTTGEISTASVGEKATVVGETYGSPNGASFHKDGRLFISDKDGELYAFDTSTGKRTVIADSYSTARLRGLNDLTFDEAGGLYMTEPYGSSATNPIGRVFYLPPGEDSKLELFQENIAYPNGIAVSADGQRVYIAEFNKNRIIAAPSADAADSPETPFVFAQFEGGIGPDGLAVDLEGNLYVAHFQAGQIVVLDKDGFNYGEIRLPESAGSFATNIAFHEGYLYVTESSKNEVWRIKVKQDGLQPYGLQ